MQGRSIRKDTVRLTVIQFVLECLSLSLNLWLSRQAGNTAMGMIALVGAFFQFASTAAGGSGYLCASRFVSEELGKRGGNPERILRYAVCFSLILGLPGCGGIMIAAPYIAEHFFHSPDMTDPVRILAMVLPLGGIAACMKGWCNAVCRVNVAAACDVTEFLVRMGVLSLYLLRTDTPDVRSLCIVLAVSMAAASLVSLILLLRDFCIHRIRSRGKASVSFARYLRFAVPVILGGCLTSALSTTNDALIPVTLRQSGSSAEAALAQFGVFEAVVIPVLFFPSTILCVLSGILIPEAARAAAGGKKTRLQYLAKRALGQTLLYSVFAAAVLLVFGDAIASLLHADALAGRMIGLLAPVVPFIYLEIVLEALIKGTGHQRFSSLNYLGEYAVRISAVLILIPLFGFYGIVVSYYASNICGNCIRLWKVFRIADLSSHWKKLFLPPVFSAGAAFLLPFTVLRCMGIHPAQSMFWTVLYILSAVLIYLGTARLLNAQTTTSAKVYGTTSLSSVRDTSS
ncbi:MAG: polysaccharide biosynthesis C-terminal domain-containing protein [Ruminococcus sp.]|nr:polysaccharide biosynthesis C-terminal domain-containing protein [Ruminococcus sp.]